MSIKRYAYGDFGMDFLDNGEFVLHSEYAALEARHNALWNFYNQLESAMYEFEKEARVERMKRVAAERFAARYKEIATTAVARHNALREAVAKMRELETSVPSDFVKIIKHVPLKIAARVKVDRLISVSHKELKF